ncbi:flagellar biosynthetic protein FliR [Thiohalorhabdus methylotrophus]|uniref:Flagellar biosynthetic protein FliR n=1 Tax=Thiohalorhabdus methylotrophus TaxID=3242694 RepID=A0ABV4TWY8_9GAMM
MEPFGFTYQDLFAGLLVFVRVMAFVGTAPLLSSSQISARIQVLLGLSLAITLYPFVRAEIPELRIDSTVWIGILGVQEVLAGALMGFSFTLLLAAIQLAGQSMGSTMGLALANVFDPATSAQINVLAQFYSLLALVLFISADGHFMFLRLLVESFERVPPGSIALGDAGARAVLEAGAHVFALGVRLAFPVLLTLLLVYAAAGVMSRAAPQIQVFFVLHPLNIALGLFVFSAVLGVSANVLREEFDRWMAQGLDLLTILGGG